jgi:hypothetical protein
MGLHQHIKVSSRIKRESAQWEKIFASYSLDKGFISRIYKDLKNQTKNQNIHYQWANELIILK